MTLNELALAKVMQFTDESIPYRVRFENLHGATIIDCGISVAGGIQTGIQLARISLAGLAEVSLIQEDHQPSIMVTTDEPVRACLASQYAGWQIQKDKFFAMGSGPMRAAYAKEPLFSDIPEYCETPPVAVGVLETRKAVPQAVVDELLEKLPKSVKSLTLCIAPAASIAGTIQVVARCLETALHKLHECHFDLATIVSGSATAPLPPIAKDELQAIGRTNDAILYGGKVFLWLRTTDEAIQEIGPKIPSNSSADHGAPFAEIFARYNNFYQIDKMLFSPAEICFYNLTTGNTFRFGKQEPEILARSFYSKK